MGRRPRRSKMSSVVRLATAKTGVGHWWMERVTAVILIPLTVWFVAAIIKHTGSDHAAFVVWLKSPLVIATMILLLIVLFYHMALGLQVVIEDYVHSGIGTAAIMVVRLGCAVLAIGGIAAVLLVAFRV